MMHYYGNGMEYGFGPLGILYHVLSWVLIIMIVVLAVRLFRGGRIHRGHRYWHMGSSALDVLRERYAKGEIDKAEFEERKKVLEQ